MPETVFTQVPLDLLLDIMKQPINGHTVAPSYLQHLRTQILQRIEGYSTTNAYSKKVIGHMQQAARSLHVASIDHAAACSNTSYKLFGPPLTNIPYDEEEEIEQVDQEQPEEEQEPAPQPEAELPQDKEELLERAHHMRFIRPNVVRPVKSGFGSKMREALATVAKDETLLAPLPEVLGGFCFLDVPGQEGKAVVVMYATERTPEGHVYRNDMIINSLHRRSGNPQLMRDETGTVISHELTGFHDNKTKYRRTLVLLKPSKETYWVRFYYALAEPKELKANLADVRMVFDTKDGTYEHLDRMDYDEVVNEKQHAISRPT